jgi:hypothetical protein
VVIPSSWLLYKYNLAFMRVAVKGQKKGKKNCVAGATCKNTCIARNKQCLPVITPKDRIKVSSVARKLRNPFNTLTKERAIRNAAASKLFDEFEKAPSNTSAKALLDGLMALSPDSKSPVKVTADGKLWDYQKHADDFMKILGLTALPIKAIHIHKADSSYYDYGEHRIFIDSIAPQRETMFHEMTHAVENSNKKHYTNAINFLKKTSGGKKADLAELMGDGEDYFGNKAYVGNYISEYVGRIYPYRITEVYNVGMENMAEPSYLFDFYKSHRDHYNLMRKFIADE